jgi:hypothetical protein
VSSLPNDSNDSNAPPPFPLSPSSTPNSDPPSDPPIDTSSSPHSAASEASENKASS